VEKGGVYLKDAAVVAGQGGVGKNNLLLDRRWGPRVRLRAVLIEESSPAGRRKISCPARTVPCPAEKRPLRMRSPLGNMTVRPVSKASIPTMPILSHD